MDSCVYALGASRYKTHFYNGPLSRRILSGERERESMGRRRDRCEAKETDEVRQAEEISHDWDEEVDKSDAAKGFFACYLLCSLSPRHKGHTYIGFTVNPQRRIKQHNGEKTCGAWRTKRGRPWEMVLCIYGFQSNVSALQFEWAWQHPRESLAVRKAASNFKSLSGVANKIKLAYTMLTLSSWENLKLTVNYFSTKYTRHTAGCPRLPNQMKVNICCMDELPCYAEGHVFGCSNGDEKEDDEEEDINKDGEEINRNISHIRNAPSYILSHYLESAVDNCGHPLQAKEPDVLVEHSKPTEEYYGSSLNYSEFDDLSKTPNKVIECRRVSSTSLTPNSCCEDGMELVRQKSTPRSSDNEAMADSSRLVLEVEVINLCTPSSCITGTKTKRALFDSEIIDLIDSPMVIQL